MDNELQAIQTAWDKDEGGGRDEEKARALADQYVADHPDLFTALADKSVHECVQAVEVFRDAGMVDEQWRVEAWLLHHFNAQDIGGPASATVRITQNG